jgi:hypothetical protein
MRCFANGLLTQDTSQDFALIVLPAWIYMPGRTAQSPQRTVARMNGGLGSATNSIRHISWGLVNEEPRFASNLMRVQVAWSLLCVSL